MFRNICISSNIEDLLIYSPEENADPDADSFSIETGVFRLQARSSFTVQSQRRTDKAVHGCS